MERIYQERIETIINSTLNQILIYGLVAFIIALLLEGTMPKIDEEKDTPSLILEVFVQLTITIAVFVFIELKLPGRYGILAYAIISSSAQKNFIDKILILTSRIFGNEIPPKKEKQETEEEQKETEEEQKETNEKNEIYIDNNVNECTSIDTLPLY